MNLKIYNTLKHSVEDFKPSDKNKVKLYTCGPTVYNNVHIGNLRSYINADVLKRTLEFNGYAVDWVMNITDVDDKTINNTIKEFGSEANTEQLKTFTARYFEGFLEDLGKINVNQKDISFVKVTDKIPDIQDFILALIKKGYAYKADDGSTYFSIEKYQKDFGDYGNLVGEKFLEGKKIGARVKVDEYDKENLSDFALWKAHEDDNAKIFWEHKDLGPGHPGWHIECSLINYLKFPEGTDIHTGGVDLIFPHHTNEIAQAQPIYKPFVNYWVHSEHIMVNGAKMAKSTGNYFVLKDLEEEKIAGGLALRYLVLQSHYRSRLNITKESLLAAKNGYENILKEVSLLKNKLQDFDPNVGTVNDIYHGKFKDALNDDIDTPAALAVFHELLKSKVPDNEKLQTIYKMDEVLGLSLESASNSEKELKQDQFPADLKDLYTKRLAARTSKDFTLSDQLRKDIEKLGYKVIDTKDNIRIYVC
ncbi:MAG: cysteine--tRNA ligase [Patescibacteria group bacterium]